MRKLAMVTAVAVSGILATPAAARDGAGYVGIDGGALIVQDAEVDFSSPNRGAENAIAADFKRGLDVGIFGGYDFGSFRLEAEGAYKRTGIDEIGIDPFANIVPFANEGFSNANGRVRVTSGMANALLDFGVGGPTGFVGLGAGLARTQFRASTENGQLRASDSDNSLAWQALAGVRFPLSMNLDAGLKYRYFTTRRLEFDDVSDAGVPFVLRTRFRSHSLLASLAYNFAPPPPPPPVVVEAPVAPPPPATQTCPDGSVILATDACPVLPPPPPPPPPTEERG